MKPIFVRGISPQTRLLVAVVLSIILIVANPYLVPFRAALSGLLTPFQYLASLPNLVLNYSVEALATREMLQKQNQQLLDQQLLMSERLQRFEHLRQENQRLRTLLKSPVRMNTRMKVAEVIEVANDPAHEYVVLNQGQDDGVFVGQPVIDGQGVVGQVVQASPYTSRVLLLSDSTHAIPVRVTRNDVRMVVNGTGELDQLELKFVAKSTDVRVGDLLVTSGLGHRFPEGYPVARVVSVNKDDGQKYAQVTAEPLAALDRIRYVLLIWPNDDKSTQVDSKEVTP
ncbi:rod shape-determining protein MreC [Parashewanella curva]|uniref:Cell shape-determining protein MreC n=1 Tax=Parashewanella curva TaxID=2338552 RepID=A0A3L8PUF2_9GAMM|nr:rod shape-determining protein MreC [Parashewanella curva]RLV59031.1 rod shape-determining protein MreC [Parashewanella curva]